MNRIPLLFSPDLLSMNILNKHKCVSINIAFKYCQTWRSFHSIYLRPSLHSSSSVSKSIASTHKCLIGTEKLSLMPITPIAYHDQFPLPTPYIKFNENPPNDMYKDLSFFDLIRNYAVMELCSMPMFVKNADKLVSLSQTVLGKTLTNALIKSTVFLQFVAGESVEDVVKILKELETRGLRPFIAVPIEELPDLPEPDNPTDYCPKAACFDRNILYIKESLAAFRTHFKDRHPFMNFKLSALIPIKAMEEFGDKILPKINLDRCFDIPCLLADKNFNENLCSANRDAMVKGLEALQDICQESLESKARLLIDSEYSMVNPTIQTLVKLLAKNYNATYPTIGGTYQCYFKDIFSSFLEDVKFCRTHNLHFSCKLVRGAYMEYERDRAARLGYPSPICDTYEDTCNNYDRVMSYCLDQITSKSSHSHASPVSSNTSNSNFNFMIASHNVDTVNFALKYMKDANISLNDFRISFAQLYGMCDYLSYFLAQSSDHHLYVYKNLPYGPVESVIPYLLRRARENFSVFARLSAEKRYLKREIKHRCFPLAALTSGNQENQTQPPLEKSNV